MSRISDKSIGTGSDQCNSKKTITKTSSTGKVNDRRDTKKPTRWKFGHTMLMLHEEISHILIIPGKPMTEVNTVVFIRARGAI